MVFLVFLVLMFLIYLLSMECINPYRMRNPNYPESSNVKFIDCPCGKCYPCLAHRRNSWLIRLESEMSASSMCFFVTLTYNDDTCDGYLHKDHLQKYIKRLRHSATFSHYSIGEFGTTTFRPHYHLLLFVKYFHFISSTSDVVSDFIDIVSKRWSYGFVSCSPVSTSASLNYVLHYHVRPKYPFGKDVRDKKTFSLFSKGLGLSLLMDGDGNFKSDILLTLKSSRVRRVLDSNGNSFNIPRYYLKKLKDSGVELYDDSLPPTMEQIFSDDFGSSDLLGSMQKRFKVSFPDARFGTDGLPLNYDLDTFFKYCSRVDTLDKKRLAKFNYQTKTSV